MTEKQTQNEENTTKSEKPFDEFLAHQRTAVSELGKAVEALMPPGFREHADNAISESIKGFAVLVNAISEEVMNTKPSPSNEEVPQGTPSSHKVKVEVS